VLKSPCRKPKSQPEPQDRRKQIVESRPQLCGPHDSQNVILVRAPVQTQWYGKNGEHSMRRRNNFVIDFCDRLSTVNVSTLGGYVGPTDL
jgi:hypothetical protein